MKGGPPKFCMEKLDNGKCLPEDGLCVMSKTTQGRGGLSAHSTKFVSADLFHKEDRIDMILEKGMTAKSWDEFMGAFKMSKATGNKVGETAASPVRLGTKILWECCTPQKAG